MKNRYRRILLFLLSCVFCLAMTAGCGKSPAAQTGVAATGAATETTTAASEASGAASASAAASEASAAMGAEADTAEPQEAEDEEKAETEARGEETETLETWDPEEKDEAAEAQAAETQTAEAQAPAASGISESDTPTEKDELAEYIHVYGHLPSNFITKQEAKDLGWVSQEGNLWDVAPGCSIGGDRFGNYEGLLPEAPGRNYTECDVGYEGGRRNARRIVFSNDGLIYYTEDHYESFELLYGEE